MTIAFIDQHRQRFAVAAMCRVLEFAERTCYAAKPRPVSARKSDLPTESTANRPSFRVGNNSGSA